jgi:DNA processing protein
VSEYPPEFEGTKYTFPERNRIISALAACVVIVEAAARSGALITADRALEQGKEVFAVPGNITSPKSVGTNELIKKGASVLTGTQDILSFFSYKNPKISPKNAVPQLDIFEQKIYTLLSVGQMHVDELAKQSGFSVGELLSTLLSMELKGVIAHGFEANTYRVVL